MQAIPRRRPQSAAGRLTSGSRKQPKAAPPAAAAHRHGNHRGAAAQRQFVAVPSERGNALKDAVEEMSHKLNALKQKNNALEERNSHYMTANARLERELQKLTRHVNQLLESRGDSDRVSVSHIRKENEKSILVKRLREQISSLQEEVDTKEDELKALRRQHSSTSLMEMAVAKEEFYAEVQRLHKLCQEKDELHEATVAELQEQVHMLHANKVGYGGHLPAHAHSPVRQTRQQAQAQAQAQVHLEAELTSMRDRVRFLEEERQKHLAKIDRLTRSGAHSASDSESQASRRAGRHGGRRRRKEAKPARGETTSEILVLHGQSDEEEPEQAGLGGGGGAGLEEAGRQAKARQNGKKAGRKTGPSAGLRSRRRVKIAGGEMPRPSTAGAGLEGGGEAGRHVQDLERPLSAGSRSVQRLRDRRLQGSGGYDAPGAKRRGRSRDKASPKSQAKPLPRPGVASPAAREARRRAPRRPRRSAHRNGRGRRPASRRC